VTANRLSRSLLVISILAVGCGGPTGDDRENRRVVEEILTAITLKNSRLLEAAAKRAAQRHDGGLLTDEEYQGLEQVIEQARRGDWPAASAAGYAFRKQHPFVPAGE
jgi:hypothetical protein